MLKALTQADIPPLTSTTVQAFLKLKCNIKSISNHQITKKHVGYQSLVLSKASQ